MLERFRGILWKVAPIKTKPKETGILVPVQSIRGLGLKSKSKIFVTRDQAASIEELIERFDEDFHKSGLSGFSKDKLGKLGMAASATASTSPFVLTKMTKEALKQTHEINALLRKKGLPVINIMEDYEHGEKERLVLVEKQGDSSLLSLAGTTKVGLGIKDVEEYLRVLGTLNSLGISHNHPHYGNFFKRGTRIGVFDFSMIKRSHNLKWNDVKEVHLFFSNDYEVAMQMIANSALINQKISKIIKRGNVGILLKTLVEPLQSSPETKRRLVDNLSYQFYSIILPEINELSRH
ncbi:MAG TPA: hypothetical protein VFF13_06450 [archaeon]|nr:hypothetical protein [archaeon]